MTNILRNTIIINLFIMIVAPAQDIDPQNYLRESNFEIGFFDDLNNDLELDPALSKLHHFSQCIYNMPVIYAINPPSKTNYSNTLPYRPFDEKICDAAASQKWGEGTWGRGYFTRYLDIKKYNSITFKQSQHKKWFKTWYGSTRLAWSSHPLIRDTARRIIAYINLITSEDVNNTLPDEREYLDKVIMGIKYLCKQQIQNQTESGFGGYIWWYKRPKLDSLNIDDNYYGSNYPTEYSTGEALRALVVGYQFLEEKNLWNKSITREEVLKTVNRAAKWIMRQTYKSYDIGGDHQRKPEIAKGPTVNFRVYSMWGLTSAYQLTKNVHYLNRAVNIYKMSVRQYQDEDGAWFYNWNSGVAKYHDTPPYYMGIILYGLVDLFDVMPAEYNPDLREALRKQILDTINHFLNENNALDPKDKNKRVPRINSQGIVLPYYKIAQTKISSYEAKPSLANELIDGLYFALISKDLLSLSDREKVKRILNILLTKEVKEANKKGNITSAADVQMRSFSYYRSLNRTKVVETRSTDSSFFLLTTLPDSLNENKHSFKEWIDTLFLKYPNISSKFLTLIKPSGKNVLELAYINPIKNEILRYSGNPFKYLDSTKQMNTVELDKVYAADIIHSIDGDNDGVDELLLYSKRGKGSKETDNAIFMIDLENGEEKGVGYSSTGYHFDLITTGDFDFDGKDEIALYRKHDGHISIYNPGFKEYTGKGPSWSGYIDTDIGDFDLMNTVDYDGDGFDEIVLYRSHDNDDVESELFVYKMNRHQPIAVNSIQSNMTVDFMFSEDVDADGISEIIFVDKSSGEVFYQELE